MQVSYTDEGGWLRNNVTLEYLDKIETPPDNYTPNKISSDVTNEKLQQDREQF